MSITRFLLTPGAELRLVTGREFQGHDTFHDESRPNQELVAPGRCLPSGGNFVVFLRGERVSCGARIHIGNSG